MNTVKPLLGAVYAQPHLHLHPATFTSYTYPSTPSTDHGVLQDRMLSTAASSTFHFLHLSLQGPSPSSTSSSTYWWLSDHLLGALPAHLSPVCVLHSEFYILQVPEDSSVLPIWTVFPFMHLFFQQNSPDPSKKTTGVLRSTNSSQ